MTESSPISGPISGPISVPVSAAAARRARWAVATAFLVNGTVLGAWSVLVPTVKYRLDLSDGELGLALLAMAIGALVAMGLAGAVAARWGSARPTWIGGVILVATLPGPLIAPTLPTLFASLMAVGAANGIMEVSMNAHAVAVERRLGRPVMSSFHGMFSLGGLTGAAGWGALLGILSPLSMGLLLSVAGLVAILVARRALLPAAAESGGRAEPGFVMPNRAVLGLGLLAMLVLMSEGAMLDWNAVYLRDVLGVDAALAGLGYAAFAGTMAVGRFLGDIIRARLGPVLVIALGAGLGALGVGSALVLDSLSAAVIGFACAGLGFANLVPVLFSAAGDRPGQAPAASIAMVASLGYLGFLIGPPAIGALAEWAGLPAGMGLIALATGVVALGAPLTRGRRAA